MRKWAVEEYVENFNWREWRSGFYNTQHRFEANYDIIPNRVIRDSPRGPKPTIFCTIQYVAVTVACERVSKTQYGTLVPSTSVWSIKIIFPIPIRFHFYFHFFFLLFFLFYFHFHFHFDIDALASLSNLTLTVSTDYHNHRSACSIPPFCSELSAVQHYAGKTDGGRQFGCWPSMHVRLATRYLLPTTLKNSGPHIYPGPRTLFFGIPTAPWSWV